MTHKYLTFLLATSLCSAATYAAQIPYRSTIGDKNAKAISSEWTLVDHNNDKKTWTYDNDDNNLTKVTGCDCGVKYSFSSNYDGDDWLFSPSISLKAATEYHVSYWAKASSTRGTESLLVYAGQSVNPDDYTPDNIIDKTLESFSVTEWKKYTITFTVPADGDYHIAFKAASPKNQYNLLLRGFAIKDDRVYPAPVSELIVDAGDNHALQAHLSWTLPTTDSEGNELPSPLSGVKVWRAGELVAELPADATSYEDTTVPEPGFYDYAVSVVMGDVESELTKIHSGWIGSKTVVKLPYNENFMNADFVGTMWDIIDVDGDGKPSANSSYPMINAWGFQSNAMGNARWATIYSTYNNSTKDEDDYLVSAPIDFAQGGRFKVSFGMSAYSLNSNKIDIDILTADGETVADVREVIGNITSINKTSMNPAEGQRFEFEFTMPAGTHYIMFHAKSPLPTSRERRIHMGDFAVEQLPNLEAPVEMTEPATSSVCLNVEKGYYAIKYTFAGDDTADLATIACASEFTLHKEWDAEKEILRVAKGGAVLFETPAGEDGTKPLLSFFSAKAIDQTPGECADATITKSESTTVAGTVPAQTAAGETLYELTSLKVYKNGVLIADSEGSNLLLAPGQSFSFTFDEEAKAELLADEPEETYKYSVSFSNLSGESVLSQAAGGTVGIDNIAVDNEMAPARYFRINGSEATGKLAPGIYLKVSGNKASKVIIR